MRVAIIGANGQLGSDLCRVFREAGSYEVMPVTHDQIDVCSPESVDKTLGECHPEAVVNCAAFHRVDDCEDRIETAMGVNAYGSLNVARVAQKLGALCVYISSDYVFDGSKGAPYNESDGPGPVNVYGVTKLSGEFLLQQTCSRWIVARVASLFGKAGASSKGGNFIETILSKAAKRKPFGIVNDMWMSPTYSYDAARALERLVASEAHGVYHLANEGVATWYEFASKALELVGLEASVEATSSASYPTKARRPRDSSLTSEYRGQNGVPSMPIWPDALYRYLDEKGHL
jgi:dTDP-4-dehydrorhamnose reductase